MRLWDLNLAGVSAPVNPLCPVMGNTFRTSEKPAGYGDFVTLRAGENYAGYTVRKQLGHGGSSEVYLAGDRRTSRWVSLKILGAADSQNPTDRAKFLHEFEILTALDHPNIVKMDAHGEIDGRLWSAHEYVPGTNASALIPMPRRKSALRRVLDILAKMSAGLDYAHGVGVVHLDVKPANVLFDPSNPATVKLSDFDQARWLDKPEPPLATDGHVTVSVPYAAPELLRAQQVCPATDQYALACTAVEFLTGRTPYLASGLMAIAQAKLHDPPPALAPRARWLPAAIDPILHKALARNPSHRYQSCTEFTNCLLAVLATADPNPLASLRRHRTPAPSRETVSSVRLHSG